MNEHETKQFLSMMWAAYPNAKDSGNSDAKMALIVWQRAFADVPFNVMGEVFFDKVVKRFKFPPSLSEVLECVNEHLRPEYAELDGEMSFTGIQKAIREISPYTLYQGDKIIDPEDRIRERMTPLEWEAFNAVGGSKRIRMASDDEMPFIRRDYKSVLANLQTRALAGSWQPKFEYPTLQEANQAALAAEEKGIDTSRFRELLRNYGKRREQA
jgi:hypothetical protein